MLHLIWFGLIWHCYGHEQCKAGHPPHDHCPYLPDDITSPAAFFPLVILILDQFGAKFNDIISEPLPLP